MSTIVTRAGKGSALTHNEVDANFVNLNTDKLQSGDTAAALTITSATINGGTFSGSSITDSGLTSGRVTFASTGGLLADSANLVWDNTNARLGIGTASPSTKLDVAGAISSNGTFSGTQSVGQTIIDSTGITLNRSGANYVGVGTSSTSLNYTSSLHIFKNQTNTTEYMRIDSAGNVGIGTTATEVPLIVNGVNGVSIASFGVTGRRYGIRNDGNLNFVNYTTDPNTVTTGMTLNASGNLGLGVTPKNTYALGKTIELGTTTGAYSGALYTSNTSNLVLRQNNYVDAAGANVYANTGAVSSYTQTAGKHVWSTAASGTAGTTFSFTDAMTLTAAGELLVGITSAVSGGANLQVSDGITFPATTVVSTNPNTLDDYEEGSFTPTISGSTTAGAGTYGARVGVYTKIGNMLYFYAYVTWTAHTGTGNLLLTALPFTSSASANLAPIVNVVGSSLTFANQLYASISGSSTQVDLRTMSTGAATAAVAMDTAATVIVTGFYYVA